MLDEIVILVEFAVEAYARVNDDTAAPGASLDRAEENAETGIDALLPDNTRLLIGRLTSVKFSTNEVVMLRETD